MSRKLIVSACDFLTSNAYSAKKLMGVAKPRLIQIDPQQLRYNAQKNRHFQPAENFHDVFQYTSRASEDFLAHRKEPFTQLDIDAHVDRFFDTTAKNPTTEFKIMRDKEGKLLGGFSTHIDNDELHVSSYYLDDAHRTKGVIQEIFEDIKRRAEENGCKSITTNIVGDDELARSQRMGFSEKKKSFWQHLLDWNVLDRYVMKNREVTCSVEEFGKRWVH